MINIESVKAAAFGKWPGIVSSLGIDVPDDPKKHGACPICGPGNNGHRFRFDDKDGKGTWICTQCGSSDGWSLVQRALGLTFVESVQRVAEVVGSVEAAAQHDKSHKDSREALNKLWKSSTPISGNDLVSQYLRSRGLMLTPDNVRYCPKCWEKETKRETTAMVAMMHSHDGKPVTIHRTYLDGPAKAKLESPKKLMPGTQKLAGAAIRLFPATDTVGVAEGIETAIACMQLFDIPTWATTGTSLMESFVPPDGVRKVVIFADCDQNFAGQKAAYRLANKLYNNPFECIVDVQIPAVGDFNDELIRVAKRNP